MALRRLLVLVVALCVLLVAPTAAAAAGKRGACADTAVAPSAGTLPVVRAALLCLHNRDRTARDLPPLRESAQLRAAAAAHARHMVAEQFFAHESPAGADMASRILGTGYGRGRAWSLGENIAWGTGTLATAAEIHRAWMRLPRPTGPTSCGRGFPRGRVSGSRSARRCRSTAIRAPPTRPTSAPAGSPGETATIGRPPVADITPLHALHYDLARTGGLEPVVAPPYDVIDPAQRAALVARSPFNVVEVDLPQGDEPYAHAAATLARWRAEGVVVQDAEPALWALEQDYTGPDGRRRTRHGLFARVRVEDYGPGRIRPHERTHPGPKEDRLRLTRATRANLSPIFSLYDGDAWAPVAPHLHVPPDGDVTDEDGTTHRLWRVPDPAAIAAVQAALAPAELLIADGHHRYETARVYADEVGGDGGHRHVLMCLVSLGDPGLTIFPTHRLLTGLDDERRVALRDAIRRDWDVEEIGADALEPEPADDGRVRIGYLDAYHGRPLRLTLKDPATAAAALPGKPEAYRRLDTAVTEALLLQGALGMSEDDISHLRGLDYARSTDEARERVEAGDVQAALFMGPAPVALVREVAAAGEVMPPKSTYFFPKVLTGLLFNPLEDDA